MFKTMQNFLEDILFCADPRRLWRRYAFALGLVVSLLIMSHAASRYATSVGEADAAIVNESGRQRMLSQRILYFSEMAVKSRSHARLEELTDAVNTFETSHKKLIALEAPGKMRKELDRSVRWYVSNARILIDGNGNTAGALKQIEAFGPGVLLKRLDAAVKRFERNAKDNLAAIKTVNELSFWCAILVLVLEGLLIFLPAHLSAHRSFESLERKAQELSDAREVELQKNKELEVLRDAAEHQAHHDALTGLANRRFLEREIEKRCAEIKDESSGVGVLHVDLDRFKQINDTLGHAAGDHVLKHVADVLRRAVRSGDFVSRIGGDEFVIVVHARDSQEPMQAIANRIISDLEHPVSYSSELCHFGASVGLAVGSACDTGAKIDPDRLLANADIALYEAKECGRGTYKFFNERLREKAENGKSLSDEIHKAIVDGEIYPEYQPQIDYRTGALVGVEALARWRHPERGDLLPCEFLPVAERLAITPKLDELIFERALNDFAQWEAQGLYVPRLAVNISAKRLADQRLRDSLAAAEIPRGRLSFEIVESAFLDRLDDSTRYALDAIDEAGIDVEIDDFGTGHASLAAVLEISPRRLKIARELIAPVVESGRHADLVRALVAIAKTLNVQPIAEGVEDVVQAERLASLGCSVMQGFLFSRPLSSVEFAERLRSKTVWPCLANAA